MRSPAVIAIGSKFVLRVDGKHIFNPAGFAIVVLLFTSGGVWISPGQWGSTIWLAALLCFFAILVLHAARRSDVAIFFLGSHAALLFARAWWLGDPLAIPIHQLQSGSLLIFSFFMISDPRTTPDSRLGRFIFALSVALLGHYMTFFMQMRPALYVALIALSPLILLIDKILPAQRFAWTARPCKEHPMTHRFASRLKSTVAARGNRRAARRARRARRRLLRLLCRQGRLQAVQQVLQGRARARRRDHRHHDGERLRGRAEGIRRGHPGADLHREEADRRGRDEDHRPSRRLHGAAAGRVSRPGSVRAADRRLPDAARTRPVPRRPRCRRRRRHTAASRSRRITTSANTTSRSSPRRRATAWSTGSPTTATRFRPAPRRCSAATSSRTCGSSSPR